MHIVEVHSVNLGIISRYNGEDIPFALQKLTFSY